MSTTCIRTLAISPDIYMVRGKGEKKMRRMSIQAIIALQLSECHVVYWLTSILLSLRAFAFWYCIFCTVGDTKKHLLFRSLSLSLSLSISPSLPFCASLDKSCVETLTGWLVIRSDSRSSGGQQKKSSSAPLATSLRYCTLPNFQKPFANDILFYSYFLLSCIRFRRVIVLRMELKFLKNSLSYSTNNNKKCSRACSDIVSFFAHNITNN